MTASISFTGTKATYVNFKAVIDDDLEDDFTFNFRTLYSEEDNQAFAILFDLRFITISNGIDLTIQYMAYFEVNESITEHFKDSFFPTVNAPAIAYPYLRSFISTLTVSAGYEQVILPTLNFKQIVEEKQKSIEDEPQHLLFDE